MTHKLILHDEEINIYDTDYDCLNDGCCLRETILYFQSRIFERKFKTLFDEHYFKIFYPLVTQMLQSYPLDFVKCALPQDDLTKYKLILFPFSDFNPQTQSSTHWSLLYIDNRNGDMILKHFDSHSHTNYGEAQKLVPLLAKVYNFQEKNIEKLDCSNQINGYDCGIYVLAYMEALIENRGNHEAANKILTPEYADEYRKNIRDYIPIRAKEIEDQKK